MKKETGLNTKELEFRYNYIKGKIAEHIVEQLFIALGIDVYRYGVEHTVPQLLSYMRKNKQPNETSHIRNNPDFIIRIPKTDSIHFIEVKYRANGTISRKEIEESYNYPPNTFIILVTKTSIKSIKFIDLKENNAKPIDIINQPEFCIENSLLISQHIELAQKVYKGLD
ncbi:MAG: hypothetical protein JNL75_06110 [Chitinophagales bacterium]|nr:hypothetical protein [Chitinophagales bacterium]